MRLGTAIEKLVENYNYAVGKEWVQDKVAWALYHTWKEADDRKDEPQTHEIRTNTHECVKDTHDKTESSSEKPNNCDTCKYGEDKHRYAHICNECGVGINNYEPKDEPTISKMEQVDKLQTKDYCDICNHKGCEYCISDSRNPYCIPSNYEPRTERNE